MASLVSQFEPPRLRFTNVEDLFRTLSCMNKDEDCIVVADVSPRDFTEIEHEREKRACHIRFREYNRNRQLLLITIPTFIHEALHLRLFSRIYHQIALSGNEDSWAPIGAATFRAQHPGGDDGEGDSAGGPEPERCAGAWPTLVIEAGVSQSLAGLRLRMQWWFAASQHDVKIVLLTQFDRAHRTITLEKWEEMATVARPGAIATRSAAAVRPVLRQTITITRDATVDPAVCMVTSGALVLGFRELFLREPGPAEGDVVLSVEQLERYAAGVWAMV
ncbi:hypothetical protein C8A05DRAFT_40759 [Staphylotrichum tortipilum]|uniref:Uncharacterized protein n=1 Tax=Staphylotrichum tortipilum TaxID=2831512 RepID=A0AAN6MUX2_9PEZI|nr:hypothetical protein C8A05DRAFT_40759 [Staphylotrichum longicolle]